MLSKNETQPKTNILMQELPEPLASSQAISELPAYSTEQADMQSAAARLLSLDDAYTMSAKPVAAGLFFLCGDGIYFQIIDDLGRLLISNPDDLDSICYALDAADSVLRAFETKLSLKLEPTDLVAEIDVPRFVFLTLSAEKLGVTIAIPSGHTKAEQWIEQATQITPAATDAPCLLHLQCVAAQLEIADAKNLEVGDMLLLTQKLAMQIDAGPLSLEGIFDVSNGLFAANSSAVILERSSQMSDDQQPSDALQFQVPVSIRLPDKMVNMETLAALKAGTNLPIGPLLQGLPIEVMIAGQKLASGEIVQIGSDFAVLISERIAPHDSGLSAVAVSQMPKEGEE